MRQNPYDTFFREVFSDPETARELTRLTAPEFANWYASATITVERDSLVPPELLSRHTDLLVRFEITGSLRFMLGLVTLKYVQQQLTRKRAQRLLGLFEAGRRDPEVTDLARLGEQLYVQTRPKEDLDYLTAMAGEEHYHYTEEDLMTAAEELLQEGMEKGIQKGQLEDKRSVLLRQLSRRFELIDAERDLIASSDDPDALDAALDEVVVANDKGSVLTKLHH